MKNVSFILEKKRNRLFGLSNTIELASYYFNVFQSKVFQCKKR